MEYIRKFVRENKFGSAVGGAILAGSVCLSLWEYALCRKAVKLNEDLNKLERKIENLNEDLLKLPDKYTLIV
ncbi:MAG: hypothetical protein ACE5ES_03960 [Candidatus Nanoarchaeia archaeon]